MNLREFFQDENGKRSMTRLVMAITTVVFAMAAIVDIFSDVVIDSSVYDIVQTVFGVGLGGQAIRSSVKNMQAGQPATGP